MVSVGSSIVTLAVIACLYLLILMFLHISSLILGRLNVQAGGSSLALCDPLLFSTRHCKDCQESHCSVQITCGDRSDFRYELL